MSRLPPALRNLRPGDGTALGEAIARAVQVAQRVPAEKGTKPPASILVLSDGAQTQGVLEPLQAAQRAKQLEIPVYTTRVATGFGITSIVRFDDVSDPIIPPQGGGQQIQIAVSDTIKHGTYANFLVVSHSAHEFTLPAVCGS